MQLCTMEARRTLGFGGWQLRDVAFSADMSLTTRLKRRFFDRPYAYRISRAFVQRLIEQFRVSTASTIFINQCDVLGVARELREALPAARIVFLSQGLESVDYLHTLRSQGYGPSFGQLTPAKERTLARQLIAECTQRHYIDGVICLCDVEMEIERWLGARHVCWVPRMVEPNNLDWSPVKNRVGFVGTLDHPPNAEGLILFARELAQQNNAIRIRVVGGPVEVGRQLANEFPSIDYLGQLSNEQLTTEAQSWTGFMHPLFCYPRGASTKLAVGIAWGIPIVTTTAGRRGYRWDQGHLIEANQPKEFASQVCRLCHDVEFATHARDEVRRVCLSSPSLSSVSAQVNTFVDGLA